MATSLSQDIDIEKAKEAGATDYFVKSNLSIQEMVDKVKSVLGGGEQTGQPAPEEEAEISVPEQS